MKFAVLAAITAMLAPMAHAQGCGALNKILAAAPGGFEDVIGAELDDDYFNAVVWIDDSANGCWVDQTIGSFYLCGWNFGTEAEAEALFGGFIGAARACLAGWRETGMPGPKTPRGDKMLKGVSFSAGPGDNAKTVVRFYASSSMADRHHLRFEVLHDEE